jgi:hypothetical protein
MSFGGFEFGPKPVWILVGPWGTIRGPLGALGSLGESLGLHGVLDENDAQKRRLRGPWGTLGLTWGHLWKPLGDPWGALGRPWGPWGCSLGRLGSSWAAFAALWGSLGRPWGPLAALGRSGGGLGVPWEAALERPRSILTPYLHVKNDAQNNQEIYEAHVTGSPKLILETVVP